MKRFTALLLIPLAFVACKKDCLKKDKCELSSYVSTKMIEYPAPTSNGQIYYVDADNGKKSNDGKSESSAFKEIDQINDLNLEPGDHVLFKRGQVHYGVLKVESSGSLSENIYFSDFGDGHLPVIKSTDGKPNSKESTVYLTLANYITFQNLNIQGGLFAMSISNSDYVTIQGCRVGERSHAGILATGKYSEGDGSDYGVLQHSLIYSGLNGNLGDGQSTDGINLNDGASNWTIINNEFKAWAHSAVSIKQIANLQENNNNVIENNLFNCGDIDYMRALDISGGDGLCANNVFRYNVVRNQSVTSHVHGNSNLVAYNMMLGLTVSDATEQPWAFDFYCIINKSGNPERDQLVCYDNTIANNLIYNYRSGQGVRVLKSKSDAAYEVHDNRVVNNIFYDVHTAYQTDIEPQSNAFENNMFFNSTSAANFIYDYADFSLADFEALNGSQGNVIQNNIETNPQFTNASSEDFSLMLGSLAIDAGLDIGELVDYYGMNLNGTPDIGPVEY
ncbi:MAG: hypothetical protein ABJG68_01865 [Crocinitomicaceae bacterium]